MHIPPLHHCAVFRHWPELSTPATHGFHLLKEPINTPEIILPSPSSYRPQFVSLTHTLNQFLFVLCMLLFVVQLLCGSSPHRNKTSTHSHSHTHTKLSAWCNISPEALLRGCFISAWFGSADCFPILSDFITTTIFCLISNRQLVECWLLVNNESRRSTLIWNFFLV